MELTFDKKQSTRELLLNQYRYNRIVLKSLSPKLEIYKSLKKRCKEIMKELSIMEKGDKTVISELFKLGQKTGTIS